MGDANEKTEVIYGAENVVSHGIRDIPLIKETMDLCGEEAGPSAIVANKPILKKYIEASKRGVRIRQITEITKNNIRDCRRLMGCMELRHLDGIHGYFSIVDGKRFNSHAFSQEAKAFPHMVTSTVKILVLQQQYFFNTLWDKAIPAKQRIKEIEEGAKREVIETIRDPNEIIKMECELAKRAEEEILILFSTSNAFRRQDKIGVMQLLKEAAARGIRVRILVPIDNGIIEDAVQKLREEENSSIDIRDNRKPLQNKLTTIVVDQAFSLTVELKDDAKETFEEAIGLATYSNSESTVLAYVSVFEIMWMQAEKMTQNEDK